MSNQNNTVDTPAATITEKELFGEFAKSEIVLHDKRGKEFFRLKVDELFCFAADQVAFVDVGERLLDSALQSDDPADFLTFALEELEGAAANVENALKRFKALKEQRLAEKADDGTEVYRMLPALETGEAA